MGQYDLSAAADILEALRHANDGYVLTIWQGEHAGWKLWQTLDGEYSERDPDFFINIPMAEVAKGLKRLLAGDRSYPQDPEDKP